MVDFKIITFSTSSALAAAVTGMKDDEQNFRLNPSISSSSRSVFQSHFFPSLAHLTAKKFNQSCINLNWMKFQFFFALFFVVVVFASARLRSKLVDDDQQRVLESTSRATLDLAALI